MHDTRCGIQVTRYMMQDSRYEIQDTGCKINDAHTSCDETSEWLNYIKDCYQDLEDATNKLSLKNEELGRKLYTFIKSVEQKHR